MNFSLNRSESMQLLLNKVEFGTPENVQGVKNELSDFFDFFSDALPAPLKTTVQDLFWSIVCSVCIQC